MVSRDAPMLGLFHSKPVGGVSPTVYPWGLVPETGFLRTADTEGYL